MTQWSSKWADKWGCSATTVEEVTLLDICLLWLWWQHRDHPNIKGICEVAAIIFSQIDVKEQQVIANRGVDLATAGELDNWGAMVDQPRNGASDVLYRRVIKAKARATLSSGNISDLYDTAVLISPQSDPKFAELYPACVRMFFSSLTTTEEQLIIFELMHLTIALGICLSFVEVDPEGVFEFSYTEDGVNYDPVDWHWGHTDGDVANTAGFAYLVE
jgi:hypothetical protein